MGHLVNACGFRLGWTTVWANYWGTQLKFGYSKFIFICARLRAFLRYYFQSKIMDYSSFLFSHFEIIKLLNQLYIKIYFYCYGLFDVFASLFNIAYKRITKWRKSYYKKCKRRLLSSYLKKSLNLKNKSEKNILKYISKDNMKLSDNSNFGNNNMKLSDNTYDFIYNFLYPFLNKIYNKFYLKTLYKKLEFLNVNDFLKIYSKFLLYYNKLSVIKLKSYEYNKNFLYNFFKDNKKLYKKFFKDKNFNFIKYINLFFDFWIANQNLLNKFDNFNNNNYYNFVIDNNHNLIRELNKLKPLDRKFLLVKFGNMNFKQFTNKNLILNLFKIRLKNKFKIFKFLQHCKYLNNKYIFSNYLPTNIGVQYPKSFLGCWWDDLNYFNKVEESIESNIVDVPLLDDCLWLYFKDGQRDISILKHVSWLKIFHSLEFIKYMNNDIRFNDDNIKNMFGQHPKFVTLLYLLYYLNLCEVKLVMVAFNKKDCGFKFSYCNLNFIDAILDNLYDRLCLSKEQRDLRKHALTINELIVAMLFAFQTQKKYILELGALQIDWRSKIPLECLSLIDKIIYDFWVNHKYVSKLPKLINLYGNFSKLRWNKLNSSISKKVYTNLYNKYKRIFPNRRFTYRNKKRSFSYAALLILLNICCGYRKHTLFDMRYFNVLLKALKYANISLIKKFFLLRWRSNGYSFLRTNMRYYFMLSSVFLWKQTEKKFNVVKFFSRRIFGILQDLSFVKIFKPLMTCFKLTLVESFKSSILPLIDYSVQFYLITNAQVNAIFLSRFVAKNLANRHRLKSFLYPLKREFRAVGRQMKITSKSIFKSKDINLKRQMKLIWRLVLLIIILTYEKYLKDYYYYTSLKISLDLFSLMIWLNKKLFNMNSWNILNNNLLEKNKKLFNINKLLFDRRSIFLLLFIQDTKLQIFTFSRFFNHINLGGFTLFPKWDLILSFLIQDFCITKYSLLSKNFWILKNFEIFYLKFGTFQYKRFLNFNYNAVSYSLFINNNKTNNLKDRLNVRKPIHSGFLGFKMRCSGRFSRRQRASSYWFSLGSVPLNTVTAFIEYASYTVTLVNSAVTIKVWVHKSKDLDVLYEIPLG